MGKQLELPFPEWKDIPGYEGLYQVSNTGLVRRMTYSKGHAQWGLIAGTTRERYLRVTLTKENMGHARPVHRLVLLAFVGECPPGMEVNHKNRNKHDNRLENLEYVTPSQNVRHCFETGRKVLMGEHANTVKLTESRVKEIRRLYAQGIPTNELAPMFGVHISNIRYIVKRKTWKHVE